LREPAPTDQVRPKEATDTRRSIRNTLLGSMARRTAGNTSGDVNSQTKKSGPSQQPATSNDGSPWKSLLHSWWGAAGEKPRHDWKSEQTPVPPPADSRRWQARPCRTSWQFSPKQSRCLSPSLSLKLTLATATAPRGSMRRMGRQSIDLPGIDLIYWASEATLADRRNEWS
jgi:hypothetical protein